MLEQLRLPPQNSEQPLRDWLIRGVPVQAAQQFTTVGLAVKEQTNLVIDIRIQVTQANGKPDFGSGYFKRHIAHDHGQLPLGGESAVAGSLCEQDVTKMYPNDRIFFRARFRPAAHGSNPAFTARLGMDSRYVANWSLKRPASLALRKPIART